MTKVFNVYNLIVLVI